LLHLNYGGDGQGFGGYSLYVPKSSSQYARQVNYAGHFIWRILEIAGVSEWSQLIGMNIRVDADSSKVYGIGNILKNDWFYPGQEFADMEAQHSR